MNPRHSNRSRFLAAENKVNELLLKGDCDIEEHWRQRNIHKKGSREGVRGLHTTDTSSTSTNEGGR